MYKTVHTVELTQYTPSTQQLVLGTAGSIGTEAIHISRGAGWRDVTIAATFNPPAGDPISVVADGDTIAVPAAAMSKANKGTIVFVGTEEGQHRISVDLPYTVLPHSNAEGGSGEDPVPSVLEQILQGEASRQRAEVDRRAAETLRQSRTAAAIDAADAAATAADEAVISLREAAERGDFDGAPGEKGEPGERGLPGAQGEPGMAATIRVGSVSTGEAGTPAFVHNSGTESDAVLDFTIPRGEKGEPGSDASVTADAITNALGYTPADAASIPTKLPNPHPLTIKGVRYDGTVPVEVDVGSGDHADLANRDASDQHPIGAVTGLAETLDALRDAVDALQIGKFPNATPVGTPLIVGSTISRFSASDYFVFPFTVDVRGYPFEVDMCFTTGGDVTAQQNIIDSRFGLALAIQNGHGIMAMSSNGSSWDIGLVTGTMTLEPHTTYYAKLSWDGSVYRTALSTDGSTYTTDMTKASTAGLHPEQLYIGGAPDLFGTGTAHPFAGEIDMSKCKLTVAGLEIWHGMDDPGLASRANVSLSNLDAAGEKRFADINTATTALRTDVTALQTALIGVQDAANRITGVVGA